MRGTEPTGGLPASIRRRRRLLAVAFIVAGIGIALSVHHWRSKTHEIDFKSLEFTCSREEDHVPPPTPEAEAIFRAAREQHRQALAVYPADQKLLDQAIAGYHKAAQAGHWKGWRNLALLSAAGIQQRQDVVLPPDHSAAQHYAKKLMAMNSATGYNLMAAYLDEGWGGILQDQYAALAYERKAADLGLPSAQYSVGKRFVDDIAVDLKEKGDPIEAVGLKMIACAAKQRYVDAAFRLGIFYEERVENYPYALFYFYQAGKMGHGTSLNILRKWFLEGKHGYAQNPRLAARFDYYMKQSDIIGKGPFPNELPPLPPAVGGSYPPDDMGWPNDWTQG